MVRIALAEDNHFLAGNIRERIELFPENFKFKFHAVNGLAMLDSLRADSNIDVILMDIQMPEMNGIDATEQVSKLYPHIKVIMLTVFADAEHISNALKAGAIGYLMKETSPLKLRDAIKEAMKNGAPMSSEVAATAIRIIRNPEQFQGSKKREAVDITKREIDVLRQLSQGLTYTEIAQNLIISPKTARKHIENIYSKFNAHNKLEAVKIALEMGII